VGCGIVGALASDAGNFFAERLSTVMARSTERGSDTWGWAWVDRQFNCDIQRVRGQYATGMVLGGTDKETYTGVGTLRGEPATEWVEEKQLVDIPPFTSPSGAWAFAHNGTIANDKELWAEHGQEVLRPTSIDSYVIGLMLDKYGWKDGIEKLEGSFAILGVHRFDPARMWWACNYKPLYAWRTEGGVIFASQRKYFNGFWDPFNSMAPQQLGPYAIGNLALERHQSAYPAVRDMMVVRHGAVDLYPVQAPTPNRVLVVCSGGLDSSTVAYYHARTLREEVTLLHIAYNCQAQDQELYAIGRLSADLKCDVRIIDTNFFQHHARSVLTGTGHVASGEAGAELAYEWVPARNLVFASLALAIAENENFDTIAFGTNQEEGCAFADNEQETWNKVRQLIPFAVKPYTRVAVSDPLGGMMKHEIVKLGTSLGVPHQFTYSCYVGGELHCGNCGPCHQRRIAFRMASVSDPTQYADVHA
jgi:7-cyano-7-deazaguanine synthase